MNDYSITVNTTAYLIGLVMVRSKDSNFVGRIGEEVIKQQEINDQDFNLVITKDAIRENTNRVKVRGVILEEYADALNKMIGVEASVKGNKVVVSAQSEANQIFQERYNSLDDLMKSNSSIENEED